MVFVVDVTVFGFGVTSVALTVSVSGDDGPSLGWGPHSGFTSHVDDLYWGPKRMRDTEQSQAHILNVSTSTIGRSTMRYM